MTLEASVFQFVDSAVAENNATDSNSEEDTITSEESEDSITEEEKSTSELIVSEPPVEAAAISEPNDTITEAIDTGITFDNPITYNDSGFIGDNSNVNPNNDVDLLKLELDTGDHLTVDIDAADIGSSLDQYCEFLIQQGLK